MSIKPLPYEMRHYSQHGEDGIIATMINAILRPNRVAVEIGWGDGTMNMTRNLIEQGWSGIGVDIYDGPHQSVNLPSNFVYYQHCVTPHTVVDIVSGVPSDFDFFSLDIDSYDFEIAKALLDLGYRPKTVCVEFNHRFGPTVQASFPYLGDHRPKRVYNKHHFHGVSLAKYRAFWQQHGYAFFGFDSAYVNLFFYHTSAVQSLQHLERHSDSNMPNQLDIVEAAVKSHAWWQQKISDIYQSA